ncbi:MAG TPA: hypothetical protein VLA72_20250 [Anaerolineales bacterium]|nr:hypothetical protein [Anaerolineales bacterium]
MKNIIVPFLVMALFLSACQSTAIEIIGESVVVGKGSYTDVNAQQLMKC